MVLPLNVEQINRLSGLVETLTKEQIIWISGYFAGINSSITPASDNVSKLLPVADSVTNTPSELTILFGSRTGNGESVAKKVQKHAIESGFRASLKNMNDYNPREIVKEKNLLLIASTHGEGEPPLQAKEFYDFLHSKRAPRLENLNFSVLALGDRSYEFFCKTGQDLDKRLLELGAKRLYERIDCDVSFEDDANRWGLEALKSFGAKTTAALTKQVEVASTSAQPKSTHTKKNPFAAGILEKFNLHGKGSERETLHVELSIENSNLEYLPGDSAGIYPTNSPKMIDELIKQLHLNPEHVLDTNAGKISLYEALFRYYEIKSITSDVVLKYADLSGHTELKSILNDSARFKDFIYTNNIVDLFRLYSFKVSEEQLISLLRKLQPRLYSIASSLLVHPDEIHLTVGVLKYEKHGKENFGVCSHFLASNTSENEKVSLFIEHNPNFKLPENTDLPIIMVGAGTGIAPYRAFIEHRQATGSKGKNRLFFGNRHFTTEFLYQTEWQRFIKEGVLTGMDVAFSRDGKQKVYVQHKLQQQGKEIFNLLENGAHFYVCGDMKKMAKDVKNTLIEIVQKQGGRSQDLAIEYVNSLQKNNRYQTDVY